MYILNRWARAVLTDDIVTGGLSQFSVEHSGCRVPLWGPETPKGSYGFRDTCSTPFKRGFLLFVGVPFPENDASVISKCLYIFEGV